MATTLHLYNFVKKHNSTARPLAEGKPVSIEVKTAININSPVFLIQWEGVPDYNYVYWEEMKTYYFIRDIIIRANNLFELVCEIDVLATAKPYIFSTSAFVKYSTVNYDPYLKDDRIVPTSELETVVFNNAFTDIQTFDGLSSTYIYILTTFSETDGIASYLMNYTELRYLVTKLIQDGDSIIGGVKQVFADAKGSIIDIKICPFTRTALQRSGVVADNSTSIKLGSYDTLVTGYLFNSYLYEVSDLLSITKPTDFTICEPYTSAKIHLPLIGVCDFSLDELQDASSIKFKMICNLSTGNVTYVLWKGKGAINDSSNKIIATYSGNCSMSLPLGFNQSINPTGAVIGAASLAAAVATGGALTLAGIAGAVASFSSKFTKSTSIIGAFGGNFAGNGNNKLSLSLYKHGLSENPENMGQLYGRPCGKVLSMGTLQNGYVETSQFELAAPFDSEVVSQVNALMDSGVYLY